MAKLIHKKQQKKLISPFCNIIHKIAEWYVSMEDVEKEYSPHTAVMDLFALNKIVILDILSCCKQ